MAVSVLLEQPCNKSDSPIKLVASLRRTGSNVVLLTLLIVFKNIVQHCCSAIFLNLAQISCNTQIITIQLSLHNF